MAPDSISESLDPPLADRLGLGPQISALVDAIGSQAFNGILFNALQERLAIEHLALYRFDRHGCDICGAAGSAGSDTALADCRRYVEAGHWRRDPAIIEAQTLRFIPTPVILHVTAGSMQHAAWGTAAKPFTENVAEAVLVCADRPNGRFGLRLVRTAAFGRGFEPHELQAIGDMANVLLSVAAKHAGFGINQASRLTSSFSSIAEIETELDKLSPELTLRERQVCARILFGLSVHGIALDLGVGEESVATYRKRAYLRLGIGSRHELFRLYIAAVDPGKLPGNWRGNFTGASQRDRGNARP
ncbi:MAG: helix-turn-helix transcriptional regulator [Rhodocyclaceae bacterium]|jgi:DNA-binding CsgD family transcriptional regulator|nr:helix-turn-helix transcriptional regulator [Rhodocyclaceae bacterium]